MKQKTRYDCLIDDLRKFEIVDDRTGKIFENINTKERYIVDIVMNYQGNRFINLKNLRDGSGINTVSYSGTDEQFYKKYINIK